MKVWENRDPIVANLLNPAYCGILLASSIAGYREVSGKNMPFSLVVLLLPFLLYKHVADNIPHTSRTNLYGWIHDKEWILVDYASRVKALKPYTEETIMFAMQQGIINVTNSGELFVQNSKLLRKAKQIESLKYMVNKATVLGKIFGNQLDVNMIYQYLKIRP